MNAEIYDQFAHLNDADAGREACAEYVSAIERGASAVEAEISASNVLQRAGHNVNARGGASFRVASIDHNEAPGERVSLRVESDERGFFVSTSDDEEDGSRYASASDAYASIPARWGNGWGLALA